ncbi:MAG: peptidoglycan-binding protein [Bacilli bacterium]|nr:peptidoglycan-binding protein [Bacilli bacterium]
MAIRIPIIPEEIIVHLGDPDEKARNITVPFIEYIKNVASGEIYPNWPLDAIKANVLAQISFALNRVYNEWYPSKGYNFDITSSPMYDQSFVENRQFFETISQVVDEFFNDYLVKDEQVQPFFAMYCDGRVTTCDGLSQWGSVSLANQGKGPLDILRNYYGNVNIVFNAPSEENVRSYPGFPVEIGTAGDFVRMLNMQLNRIGQNYPAIPVILNDSPYFTIETENAVKKFQEIFNLPITGVVDKSTWYRIKYLYNAVKKISDLYSEGISIDEATLLFNKNLQVGDSGQYIKTLNYLINVISYFDSSIPFLDLSEDIFNDDTKQVVVAIQNKYGLDSDGIVDSETWKVIKEVYRQTIRDIPSEYYVVLNEFYPGRFLSNGMSGDDIINLQKFLYIICKNTGSIPGVVVNGIFDNLTEQSVRAIQRKYNLEENGVVGPAVWYRIVEESKEK